MPAVTGHVPRLVRHERPLSPRSPRFVDEVLRPLARRARAGEDHGALAEELYLSGVHDWARARARALAAGLPAHADRNEVLSQALRLAWEACLRVDWARVESWPALLEVKVGHARREAARAEDWLSRRERAHRKRYQRALAGFEQRQGRPASPVERRMVADAVAPTSARVDWARELLEDKHPSTVAALPEAPGIDDVAGEIEDRLARADGARNVRRWLAALAAEDGRLAQDLCRWNVDAEEAGSGGGRALPARLARRVEPFTPMLVGLLDDGSEACGAPAAARREIRAGSAATGRCSDADRRCPTCAARLATDNPGPLCSPCWAADLRRRASTALRRGRPEVDVRAAFAEGGVPRLAEVLGCPTSEALDVALVAGLVPAAHRRRAPLLVRLLELGPVPHVVAAEALGLSRWTVASYRRDLGACDRHQPAARSA